MYDRNAKSIAPEVWKDLMAPTNWRELLQIILHSEKEKAAGVDGVSCDLVRLLVEDSTDEPTPLLRILVLLTNEALQNGCTPISWRKAIISMIPKRKGRIFYEPGRGNDTNFSPSGVWKNLLKTSRSPNGKDHS